MLDILHFVFSDFWVFLGTVVLLAIVADGLSGLITITINRK